MRENRGKLLRRTGQERDDVKAYNLAERKVCHNCHWCFSSEGEVENNFAVVCSFMWLALEQRRDLLSYCETADSTLL